MEISSKAPRPHLRNRKWPAPGISQPAIRIRIGKEEDLPVTRAGTCALVDIFKSDDTPLRGEYTGFALSLPIVAAKILSQRPTGAPTQRGYTRHEVTAPRVV